MTPRRNTYAPVPATTAVEELEVSTVVHVPPEETFEFLLDFPGYAEYSKYLRSVHQYGDGDQGTRYALRFSWWKLAYTARSEVTAIENPSRIEWRLVDDVDARGRWLVRAAEDGAAADDDAADDGVEDATRVYFQVEVDVDSASPGTFDLPRFVSLDWVVEKVKPRVLAEAERVVARAVADLEDEPREVDLTVRRELVAE